MVKIKKILELLEQEAPLNTAESWDNVGLIAGDKNAQVKKVLLSLDITLEVINEAKEKNADLIISHHPLFLKPLSKINTDTAEGEKIINLISSNIAAICMHTNMDIAPYGVNDALALTVGLKDIEPLHSSYRVDYQKIVVFVPAEYEERVSTAMFEAGAGKIGNYSECSYKTVGYGTFRPQGGANPAIGTIGEVEKLEEIRLEMVAKKKDMPGIEKAMLAAHPYETPAYDIFDNYAINESLCLGRVGNLKREMDLSEFFSHLKKVLNCNGIRYCGSHAKIKRVAVSGGSCSFLMDEAFERGADVFVTADVKYHEFCAAKEKGYFLVDAGHFATENVIIKRFASIIKDNFSDIEVQISQAHSDCINYYNIKE